MVKKHFKILALLLAAVMAMGMLSACGTPGSSTPAASTPAAPDGGNEPAPGGKPFEGVTVEYASCFNEAEQQAVWIKEMAAAWSAETGATVHFNFAGRDVLTSVKSEVLVGNAPDILDQDASEMAAAFITGDEILLEPLNDLYDRNAYGEDTPIRDHINGAYSLYSEGGNEYIIPFIYITSGFFYDKTLFAGLDLTAPETWDEFIAVCEAIDNSGIPALAADGNISFYNCYYFQNLCQRILGSGKFTEAALDETGELWGDPGFLEAAQKVSELGAAGKNFFQDGYAGSAYPAGQSDWAMGGAGMCYCGTWLPLETADLADDTFEYGFFPFPTVEGGKGSVTDIEAQLMSFCIFKDAKNKEAAKDFIAYCMSKSAQDRLVELSSNIAGRTDAIYPDALADAKPMVDASNAYHKNYDGAMSAAPEWWVNVFYPADDALFYGTISAEEFIEQIKTETAKFYASK